MEMETYRNKCIKKEYKTFFKQIENITLRCCNCPYIPKIKINFSDSISIICENYTAHNNQYGEYSIKIINYIQTILQKHQCEICSNKNNLYFYPTRENQPQIILTSPKSYCHIICGNCKSKYSSSDLIDLKLNSYKTIDENCIVHLQKYKYSNNLCEECLLNKNGELEIHYYSSENPSDVIEIKDINNFILSENEIENLKKDINLIESYINGIKFPRHFNNKIKEEKIFLIYFHISFIKSLINTYEQMLKTNSLNYNIIFNLRRININKDYYINNSIDNIFEINPFYNISMNKYFIDNKYLNKINDNYFKEKKIRLIKKNKINENDIVWYTSLYNGIIFCFINKGEDYYIRIFDNNFNEFNIIKGFNNSKFPILNFLNFTFQYVDGDILIQKYIKKFYNNTLGIEFFDYQKFNLNDINVYDLEENETNFEYEIYYDLNLKTVYFLFKSNQRIIILIVLEYQEKKLKKKYNYFFSMKIIEIKYYFVSHKSNYKFKFFDNNIYILEINKKLIEINLNTLQQRVLEIPNENIADFLDLDKDNILLIIYSDAQEQKENNNYDDIVRTNYFSFLNKNKFILEEKKITFRKKNNMSKFNIF